MAVSTLTISAGTVNTAAGMHEYMKEIRSHLLAVGMAEITTASSYDASETGSDSQVPFVNTGQDNQKSNWMHFAFTDSRQADQPIVVSFRTCYGPYFNSYLVTGTYRYPGAAVGVRISKGVDLSGEPLGAVLHTNATPSVTTSNNNGQLSYSGIDKGSYVRYTGESLTMFIALDSATSPTAGSRGVVQLHLERSLGDDFAASPMTAMHTKVSQEVFYSLGAIVHSSTNLFTRAAGQAGLIDNGAATVAQAYYIGNDLSLIPFKRMFTVSESISVSPAIVNLDFSGVEKPYLFLKENAQLSHTPGTATIYEWE